MCKPPRETVPSSPCTACCVQDNCMWWQSCSWKEERGTFQLGNATVPTCFSHVASTKEQQPRGCYPHGQLLSKDGRGQGCAAHPSASMRTRTGAMLLGPPLPPKGAGFWAGNSLPWLCLVLLRALQRLARAQTSSQIIAYLSFTAQWAAFSQREAESFYLA